MTPVLSVGIDTVTQLRLRKVPPTQPLDAWPCSAPDSAAPAVLDLSASLAEQLRTGTGFAVVRFADGGLGDHEITEAAWNLLTLLGEPIPQYRTGELVYPVEVADAAPGVSHYSGSNRTGGFHTDGTLLPEPPDFAALLGLSAADSGGETILMDGMELHRRLEGLDTGLAEALTAPLPFDTQGQIEGVRAKEQPVFAWDGDRFELRYLRRYIEQGYQVVGERLPAKVGEAMDRFDEISSAPDVQVPVLLERGVLLLWNNRRFLHGRLPFREGQSRRRLRRMYAKFSDDRSAGTRQLAVSHGHR